jgi:CubicO group peptidase (beta-lactamase class C family)
MASAGKFITHIAALQLVERGAISLDEPVYQNLPELESLPLISKSNVGDKPFSLRPPNKQISLRHLLLHTSGLSTHSAPFVSDYFASDCAKPEWPEDTHLLVKNFSIPLVFEPGEGFAYGYSIHWVQLLIKRLTGDFVTYIREHIFTLLGMASSTYLPNDNIEIWNRRLRMVERERDLLVPADDASRGLMCSVKDIGVILGDLISSSPRLLQQKSIDLLFRGQFAPSTTALKDLRGNPDNYAFCAGIPSSNTGDLAVNWSAAGLIVEEQLSLSQMPRGTVTWEGMPNVLWAMNREKKLAMCFATQLIPVGDEIANGLAVAFMRNAWNVFV